MGDQKIACCLHFVGGLDDELHLPIILMGEETHFVLDSTLSSDFLLRRESQYCEKSREGTSRVDIVDISDNSNVKECDDNGNEDISKIQSNSDFPSQSHKNKMHEIDGKIQEMENECFESTLHFILSSHKK